MANHSKRVKVKTPLVEMDGDEMTRIIWALIKEQLIAPNFEVELDYYDLHLSERDRTEDAVTFAAAEAIKRYGVGVKCATITPNAERVVEYKLKKEWPSPNGTIRSALDGTVFRCPIIVKNIPPAVRSWRKPIIIGRHAYGDIYKAVEMEIPGPGTVELRYTSAANQTSTLKLHEFRGDGAAASGVVMGMHNLSNSIESFVGSCLNYAIAEKVELWFAAKDTISKKYHARFRDEFRRQVDERSAELRAAGVEYRYLLVDDAIAQLMKHEGGMLIALMNYDGDVWSDLVAAGFGSLGLMTSVLVSPDGKYEFEAAHGTVKRHYYEHLKGKATSTNSVASIFAWTGALAKRGELDNTPEVTKQARRLEQAVVSAIEAGFMTKDLTRLCGLPDEQALSTEAFVEQVAKRLI